MPSLGIGRLVDGDHGKGRSDVLYTKLRMQFREEAGEGPGQLGTLEFASRRSNLPSFYSSDAAWEGSEFREGEIWVSQVFVVTPGENESSKTRRGDLGETAWICVKGVRI